MGAQVKAGGGRQARQGRRTAGARVTPSMCDVTPPTADVTLQTAVHGTRGATAGWPWPRRALSNSDGPWRRPAEPRPPARHPGTIFGHPRRSVTSRRYRWRGRRRSAGSAQGPGKHREASSVHHIALRAARRAVPGRGRPRGVRGDDNASPRQGPRADPRVPRHPLFVLGAIHTSSQIGSAISRA